jgi:outer membrane immunogenic protein
MKSLTRLFVGFCACNALALIAFAGPEAFPSGKEMVAPAPPPGCIWSGFYVGVNGGYTFSDSERVDTVSRDVFGNPGLSGGPIVGVVAAELATFSLSTSNDGFIGGGQVGYNQQFGRWLVLGVELDMQGIFDSDSSTRADSMLPIPGFPANALVQSAGVSLREIDSIGTIRGRVGFTLMPCLLVYGTGGFAYGEVISKTDIAQLVIGPSFVPNIYHAHGQWDNLRPGWTAGGGLEWMFMTHWSIKAEYLFYDLGRVNYQLSHLRNFNLAGTLFTDTAPTSTTRFDGNIVRGGLNFHF